MPLLSSIGFSEGNYRKWRATKCSGKVLTDLRANETEKWVGMRDANGVSAVQSRTTQPLSRVNPYGGLSIHHPKSFCAPTRTRTWNPLIKSQLLYQLSHGCGFRAARLPTSRVSQEPVKGSTAPAWSRELPSAGAAELRRFFPLWIGRSRHCRKLLKGGKIR